MPGNDGTAPEIGQVVVAFVERMSDDRQLAASNPFVQQRRLAKACWGGDERQFWPGGGGCRAWFSEGVWALASLLACRRLHCADYIINRIKGQPQPMAKCWPTLGQHYDSPTLLQNASDNLRSWMGSPSAAEAFFDYLGGVRKLVSTPPGPRAATRSLDGLWLLPLLRGFARRSDRPR